jgi:hypothetical protein
MGLEAEVALPAVAVAPVVLVEIIDLLLVI